MSKEKSSNSYEPYGLSGKAFQFTRDDLAANRAGFMTLSQQFGFKFWERKVYGWLLRLPVINQLHKTRRKAYKVTGKIRKHYHSKIIFTGSGGSGGGHQDIIEQRRIQVVSTEGVTTFYVTEKQYNALPENLELTLYYDKMENRIISVEPLPKT